MEALLGHRRAIAVAFLCLSLILATASSTAVGQNFYAQQSSLQYPVAVPSQNLAREITVAPASSGFGEFRPSTDFSSGPERNTAPYTRPQNQPALLKNVYKVDAGKPDVIDLAVERTRGVFRGQDYQTPNFYVQAGNAGLAKQVGEAAEHFRRELAIQWLGRELPEWDQPCPIQVNISNQAHGETSFLLPDLGSGMPSDWEMKIYGPVDRLLDSVLPHEVTHTIFATHFKQRLPRWVDEGACTMVEHESEKQKIHSMLLQYLSPQMGKGLPFNQMFVMRDYPVDRHGMLALYAQGFSVSKYLIAQGGYEHFGKFIKTGLENENGSARSRNGSIQAWTQAVDQFYHFDSLSDLQIEWLSWVQQGSSEPMATERFVRLNAQQSADLASAEIPGSLHTQLPAGAQRQTTQQGLAQYRSQTVATQTGLATLRGTEDSVADAPRVSSTGNIYQQMARGQVHRLNVVPENRIQPAPIQTTDFNGASLPASPQGRLMSGKQQNTFSNLQILGTVPNRSEMQTKPQPNPKKWNTSPAASPRELRLDSTILLPIQRRVLR